MGSIRTKSANGVVLQGLLASSDPGSEHRRRYQCRFITAGRVRQADGDDADWLLPAETLAQAAHLFEGVPCYLDHPSQYGAGTRQQPRVADLIGVTSDVRWDAERQAVTGVLTLYDQATGSPGHLMGVLLDSVLADQAQGHSVPPLGLSAVFYHRSHRDAGGLAVTDSIKKVESVDLVYSPGAAGYVEAALAQLDLPEAGLVFNSWKGEPTMTESHITEASLTEQAVSQVSPPDIAPPASARLDALENAVGRLTDVIANLAERRTINGAQPTGVTNMRTGMDKLELAFNALLDGVRPPNGVRPLSGVLELYNLLSGDYEMSGRFHADRVYLANVSSSTMAGLVANALNKRVINAFQTYPQWWAPAVTVQDFATLQQVKWITLGGIAELPTVTEGSAYTELEWDDNTETATFVKKGGYLGITLEAIDKDDTHRLQAAPRALAQAAWMTLGKSIAAIFTSNSGIGPAMADMYNLFDASEHGNLGSTALSATSWASTKLAMMKQEELESEERLGALTRPRLLWVPVDLEETAIGILASGEGQIGSANYYVNVEAEDNTLTGRLQRARDRVISVPFWTDANNWAAQADPQLYPSIGLGFRYGRTPEIFSVASPTGGLMFTNDVMPVKVRFFYAVGPTDFRGLYKHNVT